MDRIFGVENFRNEIVWQRNDGTGRWTVSLTSKEFASKIRTRYCSILKPAYLSKSNNFVLSILDYIQSVR